MGRQASLRHSSSSSHTLPASFFSQTLDLLQTSFPAAGLPAYHCPGTASCSPYRRVDSLPPLSRGSHQGSNQCVAPETAEGQLYAPKGPGPGLLDGCVCVCDIKHGCSKESYHFLPELKGKSTLPQARDSNGLEEIPRSPIQASRYHYYHSITN